jgi:hypothetical protein
VEVTRHSEIVAHARTRKFAKLAANKTGGLILRALQGVKQEHFLCGAQHQ